MDKSEFTRRVQDAQEMLYRITYGLLRNPQDRLDAVQEAILKAWCARHRLREPRYFETWLVRILINECHNRQRAQSKLLPLDAEPIQEARDDSALRDAILALPEKLRIPIMLHYMEGYKVDEIARMLRIPSGTVRTRLRRARATLKTLLEDPDRREIK